ncbi:transposase [Psychrobium sp. 1_MG-2023]|uniref:transposase n=1 Tax=Psychrobium sp. 1_MG-2023 TaxID=3062624 RepID=UPI0026D3407C|nr:transposase [Psychrobium sp. 1_MG-2023]MDP2562837.1 transposase [Psychrobium sp. 1_MG-2023]
MTRARNQLIDLNATPYYHVINRCVRRSFLCGNDPYNNKNYDHRRQWLIKRIKFLSSVFSINIAAYAIMSNHYHLVLQVDKGAVDSWSMNEVIDRWYQLFNGHVLIDNYLVHGACSQGEMIQIKALIQCWRERLYDISWFMKCLNEHISRRANKEDQCTGKFWEGRFKSQALLDETALLSCMAYVDLNPIRAGAAQSLEQSDFTSIQERIKQFKSYQQHKNKPKPDYHPHVQPLTLLPFTATGDSKALPFSYADYFELVDWSGRHIDPKKNGYISDNEPKILDALVIDSDAWLQSVKEFRRQYGNFAGGEFRLRDCAEMHGRCWYKGVG